MKNTILTFIYISILFVSHSQTKSIKYYEDEYGSREVLFNKAKFSKTITYYSDSLVETEIRNIDKNTIVTKKSFKGEEPFGIWISNSKPTFNFDFKITYSDKSCINSIEISDYFKDNEDLGYVAPKIETGEESLIKYIINNLTYPEIAIENNIQGKVFIGFTITKEGNVENIYIRKKTNILLDKESVRLIRGLKLKNPPTINDVPVDICIFTPLNFKLE